MKLPDVANIPFNEPRDDGNGIRCWYYFDTKLKSYWFFEIYIGNNQKYYTIENCFTTSIAGKPVKAGHFSVPASGIQQFLKRMQNYVGTIPHAE